jgi:ethanolaminephosphotransferase
MIILHNKFIGEINGYLLFFIGLMHLIYMNFDNMDGKQARKTGNSSALGMLFDH